MLSCLQPFQGSGDMGILSLESEQGERIERRDDVGELEGKGDAFPVAHRAAIGVGIGHEKSRG